MLYPASPEPVISSFRLPSYSTSEFKSEQGYRSSTLLSEVGSDAELVLNYEALTPSEAIDLIDFWNAVKGSHYRFRLPDEIYKLMAIARPDPSLPINLFLERFGMSPYWIAVEVPDIDLAVITIHNTRVRLRNVR